MGDRVRIVTARDQPVELDALGGELLSAVGEPRVDQPHRHDHHRPADRDVEGPVVAGADHDSGGDHRVDGGQAACPVVVGRAPHDQRHPQRPAGVQAGERGQAVGQPSHALRGRRVGGPPAVVGVQAHHVDVAAAESWRGRREQEVAGQADHAGHDQSPAGGRVVLGAFAVEPDQHEQGHDVVGGGVPEVGRDRDPRVGGEPVVERMLPVDVEHVLEAAQVAGAALRGREVLVGEGAGQAVQRVERGEEDDLAHATAAQEAPPGDRGLHPRPHTHQPILSGDPQPLHHH